MFPSALPREISRFSGSKISCFPREQPLNKHIQIQKSHIWMDMDMFYAFRKYNSLYTIKIFQHKRRRGGWGRKTIVCVCTLPSLHVNCQMVIQSAGTTIMRYMTQLFQEWMKWISNRFLTTQQHTSTYFLGSIQCHRHCRFLLKYEGYDVID